MAYPPWLKTDDLNKFWMPTNKTTKIYDLSHTFGGAPNLINFKCFTDITKIDLIKLKDLKFIKVIGNSEEDKVVKKKLLDGKLEISRKNHARKSKKQVDNEVMNKPLSKKIIDAYNKEVLHINEYIRATQVTLNLTDFQSNIINVWMSIACKVYNKCVDVYNQRNGKINTDYKGFKLEIFKMLSKSILNKCPALSEGEIRFAQRIYMRFICF